MSTNNEELAKCQESGKRELKWIGECPNMKSLPSSFCDDCERYECPICWQRYKIYDEDMK